MSLQSFWRIKIYVPDVDAPHEASLERIVGSSAKSVRAILEAIGRVPGVGEVGDYEALFELDFGFEGYRPKEGSDPQYGAIGEAVRLGKAAVVTYLRRDCKPQVLERLIAEIRKVHPWEHPVIELTECRLYVPDRRGIGENDHGSRS